MLARDDAAQNLGGDERGVEPGGGRLVRLAVRVAARGESVARERGVHVARADDQHVDVAVGDLGAQRLESDVCRRRAAHGGDVVSVSRRRSV